MAKQQDTLSEIGLELCNNLGFNPTSSSTKPLYVANGIFRSCTGIECRVDDIHEWVLSERRSKATFSEEVLEKYQDAIYKSGEDPAGRGDAGSSDSPWRFRKRRACDPESCDLPAAYGSRKL